MIRTNIILVLFISISLFWSCSESEIQDTEVVENKQPLLPELEDSSVAGAFTITNTYEIDAPDGIFENFFPNGATKVKGMVVSGKREGTWTSYYPSGLKQSENTYNEGILEGKSFAAYPSGEMMYIGYYSKGVYDGEWLYFKEDGSLTKKIMYKNGVILDLQEITESNP